MPCSKKKVIFLWKEIRQPKSKRGKENLFNHIENQIRKRKRQRFKKKKKKSEKQTEEQSRRLSMYFHGLAFIGHYTEFYSLSLDSMRATV